MPTNDERREVAARLRALDVYECDEGDYIDESDVENALGIINVDGVWCEAVGVMRLADLIEPEERTCHMIRGHLTDTVFCDVCGERFDGVAQYMAMVPNGFSVADYKAKYKDAKFCPNCGAKVVGE